ncbi:MAG TPA: dihydropteroate synthase [Chitinophagaceae bacterium]|nr:dihydropteroate synthase [Chitinophagaceae bacterium]
MKIKGITISRENPLIMGILNATPDSFYNKGRESSLAELELNAMNMIANGATILDIGGQSTRPKAEMISAEKELERVLPIIKAIHSKFPSTILSIDTFRSEVAEKCLDAGADIINDISGGELDPKIIDIAIQYKVPYICMHMQGTPETMQINPHYENVSLEVFQYLNQKINWMNDKGLEDIILDLGFGFGKTISHNYQLLNQLSLFLDLGKPLLAGLSRKSMIYKPLGTDAQQALNGTTALNMIALQNGASILRVHDVKEAKEVVTLYQQLLMN